MAEKWTTSDVISLGNDFCTLKQHYYLTGKNWLHYIEQIPQCNDKAKSHYIEVFGRCNGHMTVSQFLFHRNLKMHGIFHLGNLFSKFWDVKLSWHMQIIWTFLQILWSTVYLVLSCIFWVFRQYQAFFKLVGHLLAKCTPKPLAWCDDHFEAFRNKEMWLISSPVMTL